MEEGIKLDFAALVLMELDENNKFVGELGSYEVGEGAQYINKFYYSDKEEKAIVYFDTNKDVEEWEYTAIYDLFDLEAFEEKGYEIEEKDDEFNPTWIIKLEYIEEHRDMSEKINELCEMIKAEIEKAMEEAAEKKADYLE